jgi:hypothetical protein
MLAASLRSVHTAVVARPPSGGRLICVPLRHAGHDAVVSAFGLRHNTIALTASGTANTANPAR